jgi:NAD(P)-dependent dehydrogenase (short-subunit alcohol dehydrogenase family)
MSSGAGFLAGRGAPVYAASKFEGLANEVKPFGIRVHLIEPEISRTNFLSQVAQGKQVGQKIEGYLNIDGTLGSMHGMQPGDPEKGVQRIFEVVMGTAMGGNGVGFEGFAWVRLFRHVRGGRLRV